LRSFCPNAVEKTRRPDDDDDDDIDELCAGRAGVESEEEEVEGVEDSNSVVVGSHQQILSIEAVALVVSSLSTNSGESEGSTGTEGPGVSVSSNDDVSA